jgi:TusA-related sulfurtransferase/peroxiredoxin family protein
MTLSLVTVDCIGLQCPAPILAISKVAKTTARPATLEVRADDGDFAVDVRAWCRSTGAVLESLQELDGTFVARIALDGDRVADAPMPPPPETPPAHDAREEAMTPGPAHPRQQTVELDCRGMICPAPILQLSRTVREAKGPVVVRVHATDGDFPRDVEAWCRSMGSELVAMERSDDGFRATITVNGATLPPPTPAPAHASATTPFGARHTTTPFELPSRPQELDLRGRAAELGLLELGQRVIEHQTVRFVADHGPIERQIKAWSAVIGASLHLVREGQVVRGTIALETDPASSTLNQQLSPEPRAVRTADVALPRKNKATMLVLRNDFESLMASMMVANASAAQGMSVEVYFAFWGVNVLRSRRPRALARVSPLKRMMKWMMPAGPSAQPMSKMNFGGIGLGMMKGFMREQKVLGLPELMREAAEHDVRFIICTMSMGIMGIEKSDLMDLPNLEFGGVTSFSGAARESAFSLVF